MWRRRETYALLTGDCIAINIAWVLYYLLRIQSGLFPLTRHDMGFAQQLIPMFVVYVGWLFIFFFYGLYRPWYQASHYDEFSTLFKSVTIGTLFLFIASSILDPPESRQPVYYLIFFYWLLMIVCVEGIRAILRMIQHRLFEAGIGTRASIIVGTMDEALELLHSIRGSRNLGLNILGFVSCDSNSGIVDSRLPLLGTSTHLFDIIVQNNVKEVLVALDSAQHRTLLDIIAQTNIANVNARVKIKPDLYDVISGQAKISQMHGVPLIDVSPRLMQPWEETMKRLLDVIVSLMILIIGLPIWMIVSIIIIFSSPGPLFYKQQRIGKNGKVFQI